MSRSRPALLLAALTALTLPLTACASSAKSTTASATTSATASGAQNAVTSADLSTVTLRVGQTGWNQVGAALQVAHLDSTPYRVKWSVFTGGNKQLQAL